MDKVRGARRCVKLEHPVDISDIDTAGHDVCANQQSGRFEAPKLVKDFEPGCFQLPVYAHNGNGRQKAVRKKDIIARIQRYVYGKTHCLRRREKYSTAAHVDMKTMNLPGALVFIKDIRTANFWSPSHTM